jgi:hypothetical protein
MSGTASPIDHVTVDEHESRSDAAVDVAPDGTDGADVAKASPLAPFAAGPVLALAAALVAVLVAASTRYGFHRDELYYLWGGDHLAWGYVDHPPVVPLVAHLADAVDGHSVVGLRAVAALIGGWLVVAGALVARELGGRRRAQIMAAFAVLCVPATHAPEALYGTTAADAAVWAVLVVLFVRLLRTRQPRLWLWIGLTAGIGLETKWLVLVLLGAIVVGLALTDARRLLWSPWALGGGAIAFALWVPNLVWNATHDWAFLEFQRNVADDNGSIGQRLLFVPLVILLAGVAPIIVWWPGWRSLLRDRRFRALGIAAIVVTVAVFLAGGKPYYVAPIFVPLLAAGAVVLDHASAVRRRTALWVLGITALVTAPLTMPLLPASALDAVKPVNPELEEMVGWPELVSQARAAFDAIPPDERAHTVILADNYGTADAITRAAPELPVYSAQNSHWFDGPPSDAATTVLAVGVRPSSLTWCGSTQVVGTITNDAGVDNKEFGRPITVCRHLTEPWSQIWNQLKSFD